MKKAIGVIGGMGPEASAKFYELLIYHAQKDFGVTKNEDFPEVYLASLPVPDFIASEERKKEALNILKDRIESMDNLPIGFYCMACNTGHLLIEELKTVTKKPFVSLLEEVPKIIVEKGIKRLGILASPVTIRSKLYDESFTKLGVDLVIPEREDEDLLGKVILDTIGGKNKDENSVTVKRISDNLVGKGAQGILEGCTEIPLIFPEKYPVPVFNTLEILAMAVLKKYYMLK